jgi:DNA adenine methylase
MIPAGSARLVVRGEAALAPRRARRSTPPGTAAPIVKWAGGKGRLLAELAARAPGSYRRYFEPFLGGGALYFHLAPSRAVLGDCNADLMNMYRCVAWHVEGVIRRLALHKQKHAEAHYYATRSRWNDRRRAQSDVERAAAFIYLNKTCYNGLWRVNKGGLFNVPMGRYEAPPICDADGLRTAARLLQHAELRTGHYAEALADAGAGDFVYLDPPYQPLSPTANFTSYTGAGFGEADQHELAGLARALVDRGCAVLLSNSDTPLTRRLYAGFRIERVLCARAINSDPDARGEVGELVIRNDY